MTETEKTEEIDWLAKQFESLSPIEAGNFFIYSSHHTCSIPKDKIPLKVDTPHAFGSGHHPTTNNCLKIIGELANQNHVLKKGLDMGCGSGILSFAMATLWKESIIIGCDYDPISVQTSSLNSHLNQTHNTQFVMSDGFSNPHLAKSAPYELITANIHLNSLYELAPTISKLLSQKGYVILSGILEEQMDKLINIYLHNNVFLQKCYIDEGWAALLLKKQ